MTGTFTKDGNRGSATQAWARALELTAPIARNPHRTLPVVVA